jgi:transcriptional regulator with XRE-family HTH domain
MTEAEAQQLGRIIGAARRKQGLSYGELAALSDTDKGWLHRLENGQRADPDPVLLARVAEALGIDPARIDRASGDHLAASLPGVRTYFRSKGKLSLEAVKEVEAAVAEIRTRYQKDEDDRTSDIKAGAP